MARYSSRRSRARRRYARRRFYRRRRFSRFARRRRYRRFAKRSASEVKKVEFSDECDFIPAYGEYRYPLLPDNIFNSMHQGMAPSNATKTVYGVAMNEPYSCHVLTALQRGPAGSQQIANKVTPIKLRIYGSCIFTHQASDSIAYNQVSYSRNAFIRFIVFQVRNGNPAMSTVSENFSTVNPFHSIVPEYYTHNDTRYASITFNGDNEVFPFEHSDPASLCRLFACENPYNLLGVTYSEQAPNNQVSNYVAWYNFVAYEDYDKWLAFIKSPYRTGIGSSIRILKDKLYPIRPVNNAAFSFRFKCKRPSRLVCPEAPGKENEYYDRYKNPIYFLAIPCIPFPIESPRIRFYFNAELFYRDK